MALRTYHLVDLVISAFVLRLTCSMALASTAKSYNALLTYSIIASLGSGICETVAVMAVDDIFFLHGNYCYESLSLSRTRSYSDILHCGLVCRCYRSPSRRLYASVA
jgi:hypothetical protein